MAKIKKIKKGDFKVQDIQNFDVEKKMTKEYKMGEKDKITGTVERVIFKNEDNGYYVLSVLRNDIKKECTVTANHLKVAEGVSYEFEGQWISNAKYGNQFKADKVVEISPSNKNAMLKYLGSKFFKGVGPVLSAKIVKHFGDQTYDILKTDINRLIEVKGVSRKKFEIIKKAWEANGEINEIMIFLQSYDISTLFAVKIYERLGNRCIEQIKENPYRLIGDIDGLGFKKCDAIAMNVGFTKDCKERISAGIKYVLGESENNEGHCFLYHHQILQKSIDVLGVAIGENVDVILQQLIDDNEIKLSTINDEQRFYSNEIYYAERSVANKIDILKNTSGLVINENIVQEWEESLKNEEVQLSDEQKDAVLGAVYGKVSIITGNAGCGKTLCIRHLIKLLNLLKIDFGICCPTGKSAMRVIELTGDGGAKTIHRALGWNKFENMFMHNEKNPLSIQVLVLDEASMVNVQLMSFLLKAIPSDACIILVGDDAQLSPIGSGSPFSNLINSGFVDVYRLSKTFRQVNGGESDIIRVANEIRSGIEPIIESPLEDATLLTTNKKDCLFIDSGEFEVNETFNDYPKWHSLAYNCNVVDMLKKLYFETIPKYYPDQNIQIISPMNKGPYGTINLNTLIREIKNPPSKDKREIYLKSLVLREGDLVINTKNNYEIGITNGEIGIVKEINPEEKSAIIEFEYESKTVELKRGELLHIKLGYCISTHKYQGSESPVVIALLTMAHYPLLYRSMIYTLITRGKNLVMILGDRKALKVAINNVKDNQRQTSLIELLQMHN